MKKTIRAINKTAAPFYLGFIVLLLWQILPASGLTNNAFFPPLSIVLGEIPKIGVENLIIHTLTSLRRVLVGFVIASATALPLGFALAGAFPKLAKLISPLMEFLAQIPAFILFPVFIVIFGTGEVSVHLVIFWSALWPILFATIAGIGIVDRNLVKCARSMRADNISIFLDVLVPGSLPSIANGMKTGLTLCFMMLIGAETMGGASTGMGWQLNMAKRTAAVPKIFLMALLIAVVGLFINYLFELLEKRLTIWNQ